MVSEVTYSEILLYNVEVDSTKSNAHTPSLKDAEKRIETTECKLKSAKSRMSSITQTRVDIQYGSR